MSMIDYGAILKVDGKFINKNEDLFMEASDTGYICDKAEYDGNTYDISKNYFVCAGDAEFLLAFYKGTYIVVSNNKIILLEYNMPFESYTHYIKGFPSVKISHLDKTLYEHTDSLGTWEEYVKENWCGATGKEKLSDLADGYKTYKRFIKRSKALGRMKRNGGSYKDMTGRWLAEWEYKGKKYEVIFGYGIDPDENVWKEVKHRYGFTDKEIKIIDDWFKISK